MWNKKYVAGTRQWYDSGKLWRWPWAGEQAGGESTLLLGLWTRLVLWSYLGAPAEVHIHSSERAIAQLANQATEGYMIGSRS